MAKKQLLSKTDIEWIFAFKRNKVVEYYNKKYCENFNPSNATIGNIVSNILHKTNEIGQAMHYLSSSVARFIKPNTTNYNNEPAVSTGEIYYHLFKIWTLYLSRNELTKLCGSVNAWKKVMNEFDKEFDDLED
jgi:hypothetical protein